MILELLRGDGKQRSAVGMICGQGSDVNFCVLVRSSLICVKIANWTQQHNDARIAICSNLIFSLTSSR